MVVGINSLLSLICKSVPVSLERSQRSIDGLVTVIYRRLCDWQRKLDVGDKVSMEIPLVDFATKKSINLPTIMRPGVPLVLNFGSCT